MSEMRYESPESVAGAVSLLSGLGARGRVLAGGTDLLVQLRSDLVSPELIVDVKRIPEFRSVTREGGGWRIGAAVTGRSWASMRRFRRCGRASWRRSS